MRAELESMISRIEAHFKKEQAARKWAEEQLAQAAAERDALAAQLEAERAQQVRQGVTAPPCRDASCAVNCMTWHGMAWQRSDSSLRCMCTSLTPGFAVTGHCRRRCCSRLCRSGAWLRRA